MTLCAGDISFLVWYERRVWISSWTTKDLYARHGRGRWTKFIQTLKFLFSEDQRQILLHGVAHLDLPSNDVSEIKIVRHLAHCKKFSASWSKPRTQQWKVSVFVVIVLSVVDLSGSSGCFAASHQKKVHFSVCLCYYCYCSGDQGLQLCRGGDKNTPLPQSTWHFSYV